MAHTSALHAPTDPGPSPTPAHPPAPTPAGALPGVQRLPEWLRPAVVVVVGNLLGAAIGLINFYATRIVGGLALRTMGIARDAVSLPEGVPQAYGMFVVALPWLEVLVMLATWIWLAAVTVSRARRLP